MKKINWLLILMIAIFSAAVSISCKSKKTDSTTQQDRTTNTTEINADATLRTSIDNVIRSYDGVQADVKDGVVTLRGNIKQGDLQGLIMKVQELKPKKVENQLVIKS